MTRFAANEIRAIVEQAGEYFYKENSEIKEREV
jgi:hypothetical protein